MRAIMVKYLGQTGVHGPRLKANDGKHSVIISKPDHIHGRDVYFEAVKALAEKYDWWRGCIFIEGEFEPRPDEHIYTFLGYTRDAFALAVLDNFRDRVFLTEGEPPK